MQVLPYWKSDMEMLHLAQIVWDVEVQAWNWMEPGGHAAHPVHW
jgi:hypothetical protein